MDSKFSSGRHEGKENSNRTLGHGDSKLYEKKVLEFEPDPDLQLTPEKKTVANKFHEPLKIVSDSSLQLTPEKRDLNHQSVSSGVAKLRNRVRFDLPDISDSTKMNSSGSSQSSTYDNNETADICKTVAEKPLSDSINSVDFGLTMQPSVLKSFPDLLSGKPKKSSSGDSLEKSNNDKRTRHIRPNTLNRSSVVKTNDSIRRRINEITRPRENIPSKQETDSNEIKSSQAYSFLKKKAGLKRFIHKVDRSSVDLDVGDGTTFDTAKYHSSLMNGQHLQLLKEDDFDALEAAVEQVEKNADLQTQVTKLASVATNVDPEDQIYRNLVSLHASDLENIVSHDRRHIKRPTYVVPGVGDGPKITDMTVNDIIKETSVVESRNYKITNSQLQLSDISSMMTLYNHSVCWEEFNIL